MVIFQWTEQSSVRHGSGSLIYRNLMDGTAYIKHGFSVSDILPDVLNDAKWIHFESPPYTISNSNLPDLPIRTYLSPFGKPAQEFTLIIQFEFDSKAISIMKNDATLVPGIFLSCVGENWEIFLNGHLVRSEVHLDSAGRIKQGRTWRDIHFPLDKDIFVPGTNTLAMRIIGDPAYDSTGLYYNEPYYIDDYNIILKQHRNYLRFFFCGVLGYTGIYYLLIFLSIRKREEIFNLYYSILSFMLCVYYIVSEGTINFLIPNSYIAIRLEYFSIFLVISILCIFIEQMGRNKVSKISWGFFSFALFIGITQFFFTSQYGDEVMHIFFIAMLLYFLIVLVGIIKHSFKEHNNKNILRDNENNTSSAFFNVLFGAFMVYSCGLFDALDIMLFRSSMRLFLYSTFVFHVGIALTLSNRFSRMYKRLEQSNVVLENTVQERTLGLREQTRIAIQASKAKSQFLATMSHEIRTPLNAIIGLSEIELQGGLPEKSKNNINQIYQSGSTLLGIINDVLDISKIEAGGFELFSAEYETASMINDTINLNRVRIGSKNINFYLEINGDFPAKLIGDELRVKQILNNVLSNAIKYTNKGSITLNVTWENNAAQNALTPHDSFKTVLLRFIVRDTGIGIRKSDFDKIFYDYAQLDTRANRRIEGTGLGLVITKKLVEMMNGSINVESEYGKGSVFTIELIQYISDMQTIGNDVAKNLKDFLYTSESKRMNIDRPWMPYGKVLIVDDMPVNLQVAQGLLEPYGLQVDIVTSGLGAIDLVLSGKKYDLIFMDHMMPGMDGMETVTCIRDWEKDQFNKLYPDKPYSDDNQIPIIALTANALVGNIELFLSNGFNGFVSKPIDIIQFDEVLKKWIYKKQSEQTIKQAALEKNSIDKKNQEKEKMNDDVIFDIPGVNVKSGIAATGGTFAGYRRVLKILYKDTQERLLLFNDEAKNTQAVSAEFTTHIHALKSALATIGAGELSAVAASLEKAGRAGDRDYINENLSVFTQQLQSLVNNIKIAFDNEEKESKENYENISDYHSLFNGLVAMLKSKAPASDINIIIDDLSQKSFEPDVIEALNNISSEILMAEYDNALQIIENMLR